MSLTAEIVSGAYVDFTTLDVTKFPVGAEVTDVTTGGVFRLTVSAAVVDHAAVESVAGHPELRWLLQTVAPVAPGGLPASLFKSFCSLGADASGGATHITATGVKVGDKVVMVADVTDHISAAADFEATITVADQIQQSAVNLSAKTLVILVIRAVVMPVLQDIARNSFIDFTAIDVTELNLGYQIIDQSSEEFWVLAASQAAIDHTTAEAVLGRPDLRWLATGQFVGQPIGPSDFTHYSVRYVHPLGSNSAPGTLNEPMKTGAAAYLALPSTGGTIYFATGAAWSDGTEGHGLVAGQSCHLSEWLTLVPSVSIPGWLPYKPVVFEGYGLDTVDQFGNSTVTLYWGNSSDFKRRDPGLWLVGTTIPFRAENITIFSALPARIGWDYRRNLSDGSVAWGNIDHAHRSGDGTTTFTLSPPAPYELVSLTRRWCNDGRNLRPPEVRPDPADLAGNDHRADYHRRQLHVRPQDGHFSR